MQKTQGKKSRMQDPFADKVFHVLNWTFLTLVMLVILLPLMNVVSSSLSDPFMLGTGQVRLFPRGFNLDAYRTLLQQQTLMRGFYNTLFYTIVGTTLNVIVTIMCAYPLSRDDLPGRKIFMFFFTFTMLFSGGMIPTYLLIHSLNLLNTRWVMILPGAMSVFNMIIARTFFMNTIPKELSEAAEIDGASDFKLILTVILPLSKPIIAVLILFYAQGHWNSFFSGFMYLTDRNLFPLQVVLRNFITNIAAMLDAAAIDGGGGGMAEAQQIALFQDVVRYAVIVFTSIPIILVYPFAQKYFIKGVMIGSLKG